MASAGKSPEIARMKPKLSIVVPLYNEVENVELLYLAISGAVVELETTYEIIFVDDGSNDGTVEGARQIQQTDASVRLIQFRKNFGQTAAMRAGIQAARGSIIVTMDGDLQNDPSDMGKLVAKIEEGYDLVVGWRKHRKDPALSRNFPSRVANRLIGWLTGVKVHDSGCSLKAYRAGMIKRVPLYSEMHRFIPAMSTLQAARITEVVVNHQPRQHGESKYGISRVGKVLLDVVAIKMLISFRHRPMQWFSVLALPFLLFAGIAGSNYLLTRLAGDSIPLLVSPIAFLLFLYLAFHFLCVGLLAELVIRSGQRQASIRARTEYVDS